MIKIAATSDNHLDINKIPVDQAIKQQAHFLKQQQIGYYLIAGDMFNDFEKTVEYVQKLTKLVSPTKVLFIAGNHDMIKNVTYEQLETGSWPGYLNNRFVDIPNSNYRIIGLNGWYDYSFADNMNKKIDQFYQWKMAYWIDSLISQPMSDVEREGIVIAQLDKQLQMAKNEAKKVILMTHFVPNRHFIRYTTDFRFWNMANAMMGSKRIEDLINHYQVERVIFGHIHQRIVPIQVKQTWYYNAAVGYHNHRHNEWSSNDFIEEWQNQLKIIQLF